MDGTPFTTHITLNGTAGTAGSVTSSDSTKGCAVMSDIDEGTPERDAQRRPMVYDDESGSEQSAEDDDEVTLQEPHHLRRKEPPLAPINTSNLPPNDGSSSSPVSPNSRAWYEFDLAVVVALVSPIGNWLTGGDHIKNVFLIILLIFYLHQIIEIPWELYRKARPRRRAPDLPASTAEDRYKQIATSELRVLEFFFLSLTALSPFLGAMFLRYATAAVIGQESVSWFSTALFVLATGMRPWSHVVERFRQRTEDLHDVVHYPSPDLSAEDMRLQMAEMVKRVEHLERALAKAQTRLVDATDEVYEYVDEAVTAVDRTVKRQERKYEKQEAKMQAMEMTLEGLNGKGKGKAGLKINTTPPTPPSLLASILPDWMSASSPHRGIHTVSPSHSPTSRNSMRSFPSSSTIHLETIPEEDTTKYPVLAQPVNLTSLVLSRIGYFATMPLRAVVRMILRRY
ncbi:hypothetical protein LshimejAT787_1602550 [Lyophyllum shimeji]|uniref:Uncharacterized protein n=1 Tax=Lyophyllum shimeji TaxID=47721 RepID=A0A9P3PWL3_LYOSH|nr:hypothetical protein LshimejAT787_1602550 [Lyophyllum shimeji]